MGWVTAHGLRFCHGRICCASHVCLACVAHPLTHRVCVCVRACVRARACVLVCVYVCVVSSCAPLSDNYSQVPIPKVTQEGRKKLTKQANSMAESAKVSPTTDDAHPTQHHTQRNLIACEQGVLRRNRSRVVLLPSILGLLLACPPRIPLHRSPPSLVGLCRPCPLALHSRDYGLRVCLPLATGRGAARAPPLHGRG